MYWTITPSFASRPAFLAAEATPRLRRRSTAESKFPSASVSAFLQSISPALVISRSLPTFAAVISAITQNIDQSCFETKSESHRNGETVIRFRVKIATPAPTRPVLASELKQRSRALESSPAPLRLLELQRFCGGRTSLHILREPA